MNFEFKENFNENLLEVIVSVDLRIPQSVPRITCGFKSVKKAIEQKYACPPTHILGECLNPVQSVDNENPAACIRTWYFHLTPKKVSKTTKPTNKKTTSRKKRSARTK